MGDARRTRLSATGPRLRVDLLGDVGLAARVASDPDLDCRRLTPDGSGAVPPEADAPVLVVDLDVAGDGGISAIALRADPALGVVVLAVATDGSRAAAALAAGASDFALLPRDDGWLRSALRRERRRRLPSERPESGGRPGADVLAIPVPAEGLSFEAYERRIVEHALARAGGNRSRAARELGISRPRLLRKIERYGLREDRRTDRAPD